MLGSDSTSSFLHHNPCSCNDRKQRVDDAANGSFALENVRAMPTPRSKANEKGQANAKPNTRMRSSRSVRNSSRIRSPVGLVDATQKTRATMAKAPLQQPVAEMERKPTVVSTIWTTHHTTTSGYSQNGIDAYPEKKRRRNAGIPDGIAAATITAVSFKMKEMKEIYDSIITSTASGPLGATKVSTMPQSKTITTTAVAAAATRDLYRQRCHRPQRRQRSARHFDPPAARTTCRLERLKAVDKVSKTGSAQDLGTRYATGHFKPPSGQHIERACNTDEVSRNCLIAPVDSESIFPPARICDRGEADSTPGRYCSDDPEPSKTTQRFTGQRTTRTKPRGSWPKGRITRAITSRDGEVHRAHVQLTSLTTIERLAGKRTRLSLSHKSADLAVTRGPVLLDPCLRYSVTLHRYQLIGVNDLWRSRYVRLQRERSFSCSRNAKEEARKRL
ncbi:hypothetical protein ZHAS_00022273 [Anopheles sinensis]|uniref:Uncharacterized protein n=1 Tax=Anopheles sinensis TaxID=74873 RepID=A0A084WUX2_ANOSI|nr:hypothetical protein ZHAS_00022273 [Anopheles sinensis]